MIVLENHMTWPMVGSIWSHHSGRMYKVLDYTNIETDRQDRYPTTIVYQNTANLKKYSRPLMDWDRSFVHVSDPYVGSEGH
jgi:hypothetical protein